MANYYIGSDGVRYEQSSDGAFYITQDKADDNAAFNDMVKELEEDGEQDK